MQKIITRFAPSPTGYLHIGGARTALFNYLFAKHTSGKFLLRIEDTDRQRSTPKAVDVILQGLKWLGLEWDCPEIYQFSRLNRHKEVAYELLDKAQAYKCFLSPQELEILREESMRTGAPIRSKWRNADPSTHPKDQPFVIRIKAPQTGTTIIDDQVQGQVTTENHTLDDMVLLRSDGTPTYMLAVVVDDHDMEVTHIIRGDDHLSNTARQVTIYQAMNWKIPVFAHIPLIHGTDGKKLSKRHGALGVDAYQHMGYLPEALCNYLLRLGWSHGDDELINKDQAIEWFNLAAIGKSPSRLDFKKLDNINNHYMQLADNKRLLKLIDGDNLSDRSQNNILAGLDSLKQRAKTLIELKEMANIYIAEKRIDIAAEIKEQVIQNEILILEFSNKLKQVDNWNKNELMNLGKAFAEAKQIKLGELGGYLRIILTGSTISPSVFEIMAILGIDTTLRRIADVYNS